MWVYLITTTPMDLHTLETRLRGHFMNVTGPVSLKTPGTVGWLATIGTASYNASLGVKTFLESNKDWILEAGPAPRNFHGRELR